MSDHEARTGERLPAAVRDLAARLGVDPASDPATVLVIQTRRRGVLSCKASSPEGLPATSRSTG